MAGRRFSSLSGSTCYTLCNRCKRSNKMFDDNLNDALHFTALHCIAIPRKLFFANSASKKLQLEQIALRCDVSGSSPGPGEVLEQDSTMSQISNGSSQKRSTFILNSNWLNLGHLYCNFGLEPFAFLMCQFLVLKRFTFIIHLPSTSGPERFFSYHSKRSQLDLANFRTKSCSILLFNCSVYSSQTKHAAKREEEVDPTIFVSTS